MDQITRRTMLGALIAAAGAAPALAAAQLGKQPDDKKTTPPPATPAPATGPNPLARLMTRGDTDDRTLTTRITISAFNERDSRGVPIIGQIRFDTAAILFPVLRGCASSTTDLANVTSELRFNDQVVSRKVEEFKEYQSGAQFGRWEMKDKTGSEVELKVVIPMTCFGTRFDEKSAMAVKWPSGNRYPKAAASTLEPDPLADFNGNRILDADAPEIVDLLKSWTGGKDPKALPPVQLAKFLLGKVSEYVQTSGDGLRFGDLGAFEGLLLQRAATTARTGRCSEHDMANFLATIYRAAGLPARTVIGYDTDDERLLRRNGDGEALRSWVEFALVDESGTQELWVPVDPVRQRKSGTRVPQLERAWEYFGTIDDLHRTLPFAFQYHPPTTVVAHGHPAFWGWFTTPELQIAEQKILFSATGTAKRGGQQPSTQDPANPTMPKNNPPAPAPKKSPAPKPKGP